MREIGISPRFSRDKFVPLQTKQRYSTRDISGEVFLTLFFRGFVPFLSLADFVSRNKNLQVADLQRLKSCFGELVTATTRKDLIISASLYNLKKLFELCGPMIFLFSFYVPRSSMPAFFSAIVASGIICLPASMSSVLQSWWLRMLRLLWSAVKPSFSIE